MHEDYLQYLWKIGYFLGKELFTAEGERIDVIQRGVLNVDSGPDFSNARIRIGDQLWVGNVEIHVKSSEWNRHKHQNDRAYNSVVLHVVYEDDKAIRNMAGSQIPTISIKHLIDHHHYFNFEQLRQDQSWIPCSRYLGSAEPFSIVEMVHSASVNRLEKRAIRILESLQSLHGDWECLFYHEFLRVMGMRVNSGPMIDLAQRLPFRLISKYCDSQFRLEALLFGQSGLLDACEEDGYVVRLKKEYGYLKVLHGLNQGHVAMWKFSRMRPPNFPTSRLAEVAAVYSQEARLFQYIREHDSLALRKSLQVSVSRYWQTRFRFGSEGNKAAHYMGDQLVDLILINLVAPLYMAYGKYLGDPVYEEEALALLENLAPESNSILKRMKALGFTMKNAFETQGCLELYVNYCLEKRCLDCKIGCHILKPSFVQEPELIYA